jgi:virginiamycin B lyase
MRFWRVLLIPAVVVVPALAVAAVFIAKEVSPRVPFVEYKMPQSLDIPTAIAAAPDGTVWFSMDLADSLGHVLDGRIQRVPVSAKTLEPIGLGVAPDGSVWYTDNASHAISHVTASGDVKHFPLDTPSVRLARLAVAPDGAAWFAEETGYSITRLKDGVLTRHVYDSPRGGPYGVTVAADGTVWATLQSGDQLLRISPDGVMTAFDIPRPAAVPSDIAVGPDGAVWFLEFRADSIGRFKDEVFREFPVGEKSVGLSGLAVGPDGAVWFGMLRAGKIGRLRDGKIDTFTLPREHARPYTLALDRQGNVWYADIAGYVGMLPASYAMKQARRNSEPAADAADKVADQRSSQQCGHGLFPGALAQPCGEVLHILHR